MPNTSKPSGFSLATATPQELRKLYYRSRNLIGIAVFMGMGTAALLLGSILRPEGLAEQTPDAMTAVLGGVFGCATIVGLWLRTHWGRLLGILTCALWLISGSGVAFIIGLMGLVSLCTGGELFGPTRVTHEAARSAFLAARAAR